MAATSLAAQVGVAPACRALGLARATFYRRQRPTPGSRQPHQTPARALDRTERERVLDMLASPRFLDRSPGEVVGWMVAKRENAALAARLIEQSCLKQHIQPQVLTLHSDRGAPMTAKCTAQLLADLGVTRSLGRPQVSDDNPFSEAQFKTLKYHPGFPGRFEDIHAAVAFCRTFFPWYNREHRHAGIAMLTPSDVHHGRAQQILEQRQRTLQDAWAHYPERFVHGPPKPQALPKAVWINPPTEAKTSPDAH